MRPLIDLAVRRPVATAAIYVALTALGAWSFRLIPLELLPDVDYPRLTVTAAWAGASPETMEARVTAPLEAAARQVRGVRRLVSTSRADERGAGSLAELEIEFERGTRMEFARLDLSERISALRRELPPGVSPRVEPYTPPEFAEESRLFLGYRLTGPHTPSQLARIAEEETRPVLLGVDGVAAVSIYGGEEREIEIVLDRDRLEAHRLRPEDVARRVEEVSRLRAPGSVELEGRQVALAVRTRVARASELEELVLVSGPGGVVRLGDVGRVRDATADPTGYFRVNGEPTISLFVDREVGTNAVRLAERVKAAAGSIQEALPAGVRLELDRDQSREIRRQLTDLRLRAVAAALVIFLVLALFLRSLGAVLAVFATIGFSVLIAVNLLYLGGWSLNVLTLAGLAWGFGLIVDNGIVVLENVERRRRGGERRERAAREGARQVALPVLAATATTAIVLVPFLFLQGELRVYYLPLGWAVGFSILASLFVAFSFVPAMAARVADPSPSGAREGRDARAPLYARGYRALLERALDHPLAVTALCLACLAGSWWLFDRHVTRGVSWSRFWGQETFISVQITFPRGAGLERTDELARAFEARIAALPEVARFETQVRPNWAYIRITFPEEVERTAVPVAIKERMVAHSHEFSGAEVRVYGYGPSFYGGGGAPPNYSVSVLGYNYLKVREIAEELAARLRRFGRIADVDPNASGRWFERDREFEYFLAVDRERLGARGLSVEELLRWVSAAVRGGIGGERLRVGAEEVPYRVKLAGFLEFDVLDLEALRVPTAEGGQVRVAEVARVERRPVISRVIREDQQYQRRVAWEFRGPVKLGDLVRDVVLEATELPPGYRIEVEERWRWSEEERAQVYLAIGFAVLLIYMVTAALFESLAAPLVVLLTLPLALIGVFLVFFYTGADFTRTAYIGTIMMAGIVVNNAILVVYHIGELRGGLPLREAIVRGTVERVRPILMTTATTVLGLLPLVLFAESQNENIWNALALATIGGLLSSTVFVLIAIPVAYRWLVARRG